MIDLRYFMAALGVLGAAALILVAVFTNNSNSPSPANTNPGSTSIKSASPQAASRPFDYSLPVNPYERTPAEVQKALDMAQEAGVNSISTGAAWWYLTPGGPDGDYRWGPLDYLVEETRQRGMSINIGVTGTPDWVRPDLKQDVPDLSKRIWYPPRGEDELRYFGEFMRVLVQRYGTRVERYGVWNEPNIGYFWEPAPVASEYTALLRTAYISAKEADPQVKVVFGGISKNDIGYLSAYYAAARQYPDAKERKYFFDELDVHPYTFGQSPDWQGLDALIEGGNGPLDQSFIGITKMKAVMDQNGDGGKQIFLGEFGYSTTDTWMQGVPDDRRALYLKRAYSLAQSLSYVTGLDWYTYRPTSADSLDWAIVDRYWNPSLTYRALKQVTGAEASDIKVKLNPLPAKLSGTYILDPVISGTSKEKVTRWELYVDGVLTESSTQPPLNWDTRKATSGKHSLMVAAYTADGSVWPSKIVPATVSNLQQP